MNNNKPFPVEVKKDTDYYWCTCGLSTKQPFCDGSHKDSDYFPFKFHSIEDEKKFFCGCKKTKNKPFCDGSHNQLKLNDVDENKFVATVYPENKKIDISKDETILIASFRNNISHHSACGGAGKCSTCRVEVIDGLENCYPMGELESKLSKKLSFAPNIRLGCQTKLKGNITYKRLLLNKSDVEANNQVNEQKLESVGTIRNLTILFCDIKGFTPFSESLSAYDVIFILNRYFSIMRDVMIRHGGEINNYIGDAILAIFGLKESKQQNLRAVSAGVEMIKAMDEFKLYLKEAYGREFDIRVGIHYGEVISGSVGFGEDKKDTVIGDTVNTASRIEAINKEAGTRLLISETVYEKVKKDVTVNNFLRLKLRGTSNLITLHEVSKIKRNSLRLDLTKVKKVIKGKTWYRTLPIKELNIGEKKKYKFKDKEILLINQKKVFAIENICPHMDLPLDIGQITEDNTILCHYHNSEFCFKSGEVKKWVGEKPDEKTKGCEPLNIINVISDDDYIWVSEK